MTDIVERLRALRPSQKGVVVVDEIVLRMAADEIERLRAALIAAAVDRAWRKSVEVVDSAADDLDRLINALAECIVARQGLPNRDRAKAVLAEIEAQGWRLLPPKEEP